MKLLTLLFMGMLFSMPAYAQNISKGDVQRLKLDQITLDGTVVTATGAEINTVADGITATAAEINRISDLSTRTNSPSNTCTITAADYEGEVIYLSASGGNQACTLPDGGTATNGMYKFKVTSAPTADYTITISPATGDNSTIIGNLYAYDLVTSAIYGSAPSASTDTLVFNSVNSAVGDSFNMFNGDDSTWYLDGNFKYVSVGEDGLSVLYSSVVTSTD